MNVRRRMLTRIVPGLFACAVWVLLAFPAAADGPRKTVWLLYEPTHNPPRAFGQGTQIDWNKPGLTLEILRLVEERLNVRFVFKRVPWKRGLFLVEKDEADGIFHASYKSEREKIGAYPMKNGKPDPSRAIFRQSYVLYKRADSPLRWDGGAITPASARLGAVLNYSIVADLRKKGYLVEEARDLKLNFDKLVNRRIDAFAGLENMSDAFLATRAEEYREVVKLKPAIVSKPYYLLLSHGFVSRNPTLAEQIWDTVGELRTSPQFMRVVSTYLQ